MFESVTIFFSDIVSFTRISAAGTPIDVVQMLNMMYTTFDDISTRFDMYKVATIGDAYFVASGVPKRNGDQHASEICGLATELLAAVSTLPILHIPGETLKMRIGIHSGPCLAGVVGVKMPRYLLFGDTIDIASAMESGGESMRIHISKSTSVLLQTSQFFLQPRIGGCPVKGHDVMETFWLSKLSDKNNAI
jgi:class 3 adenylate cyclase